ncbi:MAG: hypothetical protein ACMXYC_01830, partial [Candidatus Woesearchaeota archaeon]
MYKSSVFIVLFVLSFVSVYAVEPTIMCTINDDDKDCGLLQFGDTLGAVQMSCPSVNYKLNYEIRMPPDFYDNNASQHSYLLNDFNGSSYKIINHSGQYIFAGQCEVITGEICRSILPNNTGDWDYADIEQLLRGNVNYQGILLERYVEFCSKEVEEEDPTWKNITAIIQEYAFGVSTQCEVIEGHVCPQGYDKVAHMFKEQNSHASYYLQSGYNYTLCCGNNQIHEINQLSFFTSPSACTEAGVFSFWNIEGNSHVGVYENNLSAVANNYDTNMCVVASDPQLQAQCYVTQPGGNCQAQHVCVYKTFDVQNAHIASCDASGSLWRSVCCGVSQGVCLNQWGYEVICEEELELVNQPPVFDELPSQTLFKNSGLNFDLFDLLDYVQS